MILVLLGTQNNSFHRLLEEVENNIKDGTIKEEVIVQAGYTKFQTHKMRIIDLISKEQLEKFQAEANLIITHGGVGSIITSIKKGKKVIAIPRRHEYGEHVNNHQIEIVKKFDEQGYIIGIEKVEELKEAIIEAKKFEPKKYETNNKKILKTIQEFIDKIIKKQQTKKKKVLFISSTGGHLDELIQLEPLFEKYDYNIITEKDKANENLKEKYKEKLYFLPYGTRAKLLTYIFKYFYLCLKTVYLYFKIRPKVIVTTGTHTAGPMCILGKIFGSKIIYIETYANNNRKTATGRLIYPIADLFIVQWEEMLKIYPKAVYAGSIY